MLSPAVLQRCGERLPFISSPWFDVGLPSAGKDPPMHSRGSPHGTLMMSGPRCHAGEHLAHLWRNPGWCWIKFKVEGSIRCGESLLRVQPSSSSSQGRRLHDLSLQPQFAHHKPTCVTRYGCADAHLQARGLADLRLTCAADRSDSRELWWIWSGRLIMIGLTAPSLVAGSKEAASVWQGGVLLDC